MKCLGGLLAVQSGSIDGHFQGLPGLEPALALALVRVLAPRPARRSAVQRTVAAWPGNVRSPRPSARARPGRLRQGGCGDGGVEQRIHFLAVDLPHSDGCFVRVDPVGTTEVMLYRLSGPAIPRFSGQACRSIESLSRKKSRHTEEQVAFASEQAELGASAADMCRKTGVSETADQPGRPSPPRQVHGPPGQPAAPARVGFHGNLRLDVGIGAAPRVTAGDDGAHHRSRGTAASVNRATRIWGS